jgi:hypothetical protein
MLGMDVNTDLNILDSSFLKPYIPMFDRELGPNIPLQFDISFKDIKVNLGQYDESAIVDYTTCITAY